MKKKICLILSVLMLSALLSGCFCIHRWTEATCEAPKTCSKCGETEGEALGHSWEEATCQHPETCSVCGKTQGQALEHNWQEATTETPKTCSLCGETQGERIITDPRFTTASTAALQGTWVSHFPATGELMGIPDFEGTLMMHFTLILGKDGSAKMTAALDEDLTSLMDYVRKVVLDQLAQQGIDETAADSVIQELYGMSLDAYIRETIGTLGLEALSFSIDMVYYVDGNNICTGSSWDAAMEIEEFRLEDGKLYLTDPAFGEMEFTREVSAA